MLDNEISAVVKTSFFQLRLLTKVKPYYLLWSVWCTDCNWEVEQTCQSIIKGPILWKNTFSLVSTYISWSSLSLPTPRMRKANNSCMVSAAHPLVTRGSYTLFRFSSWCYVKTGEIFIGRPPLHSDRRYLRAGPSSLRWRSVCRALR